MYSISNLWTCNQLTLLLMDHLKPFKISTFKNAHWFCTHIMIRFVARTYPPCWVLKARIQKHRGKPLLFHDKCPGFFYVHYTTHGTYSFTSHPKDEAIMVKCLAQEHKRRDRPGFEPTFWQHQNLSPIHSTAPPQHSTWWYHLNSVGSKLYLHVPFKWF